MKRVLFAAAGAAIANAALLSSGCGTDPKPDGSFDASESATDSYDAGSDRDVADAGRDWWSGCPALPVVCPDAAYFITINGDGPEQTLHSNTWEGTQWFGGSPGDAGYHLPVAQYYPPGMFSEVHSTWASDTPEGGTAMFISPDSNTCYDRNGTRYCSAVVDAQADVTYAETDPPGGFVAGSYSVSVASPYDAGVLVLSGKFFACRVCDAPPIP